MMDKVYLGRTDCKGERMGLFRPKPKYTDRVWLTGTLKDADILKQVAYSRGHGIAPIAITHFPETQRRYESFFKENGLRISTLSRLGDVDRATGNGWLQATDVILMDSELIRPSELKGLRQHKGDVQFALHLLERYPLPEPDECVLDLAMIRSDMTPPTSYVALDEPWVLEMVGPRVTMLLEQLDIDENEVLQHSLMSSSFKKAQTRMAERVVQEVPSQSLEEWLQRNTSA